MKIKRLFMLASIIAISFTSCEKDEKDKPEPQPEPNPVDTTNNNTNEPPIDFMASKDSSDRNLYIELYTGVRDANWPSTSDKLYNDHGALEDKHGSGRVMIGVMHQGKYAADNPTYKTDALFYTDYGTPLAVKAYAVSDPNSISPYSAGSLNRIISGHGIVYSSANANPNATVMNKLQWLVRGGEVLEKYSSLNIGAKASILNDEIKVDVDLYFTGNEPDKTFIHVALLQDGIIADQSPLGPGYTHNDVFRDMITPGLNGDPVNMTTTPGTWLRRNYTYQIPTNYNGTRGGKIVNSNLKLVIYVTKKSDGQIITAKEILL